MHPHPQQPSPRPPAALLLAGALALAAPLLLYAPWTLLGGDQALGLPDQPDVYDHLWLHGWLEQALRQGASLSQAPQLSWPEGGALLHPDPLGFALYLPLSPLLGRAGAFNVALLLQVWLAGLCAWLLAAHVCRSWGAGWVAGLCFGFSPYLLGQVTGGQSETLAVWPLVLSLYALERCAERASPRWALVAGALGGLCAIGNWYYGAFWLIYAAAWGLLRMRRRVFLLVGLGAGAVALGPVLVYARVLRDAGNIFRGPSMLEYMRSWPTALSALCADPAGWLGPSPHVAASGELVRPQYLGALLVFLTLAALLRRLLARGQQSWPRRRWWFYGVALTSLLLALGPLLHFAGSPVTLAGHPVPLPYWLLAHMPLFGLMRLPFRWIALASLCLCLLVAWALRDLLQGERTHRPWLSWLVLGGAAALHCADVALFAAIPFDARVSVTAPAILQQLPGDGALLQLPPRLLSQACRGHYLVWQRAHGRPLPYSLLMRGMSPALSQEPLVQGVAALDRRDDIATAAGGAEQLGLTQYADEVASLRAANRVAVGARDRALQGLGIQSVVLHEAFLHIDDLQAVRNLLNQALGPPAFRTGSDLAWILDAESAPTPSRP